MSGSQVESPVIAADAVRPPPLIAGDHELASVTAAICSISERPRPPLAWYIAFGVAATFLGILGAMVAYLFWVGTGVWGIRIPVAWGWAIVNFVW
jgi:hypothetical protein